ncbi:hypothetical protein L6164_007043 [Bauhinia variegata]|nr:hypothetical protein L6164_007043 [Bauhinia variegata]
MISRIRKIPLKTIEHLKWDLGLPQDYLKSIIPEFPDYFQIVCGKDCSPGLEDKRALELVCWSNELAISVMEKKVMNGGLSNEKGKPIAFPMQFSTGFEMDKKFKKCLDGWQKLPYISPYENAIHLSPTSDESDKWVVAVLHEILHILVPKKTEKENVLLLGECLGLRSRFKRALLHHPGIFYLSSKIGTYTVVLREGYKRGSLIESHPMMTLRSQYVHLVNTVKEDSKTTKVEGTSTQQEPKAKDPEGISEEDGLNSGVKDEGELFDSSDAESEDASSNDYDDDEEQTQRRTRRTAANCRDRTGRKMNSDVKKPFRNSERGLSAGKVTPRTKENIQSEDSKRKEKRGKHKDIKASQQRSKSPKSIDRLLTSKKSPI